MFFTNKKLKEENVRLTYRVAELEERLCPCEQGEYLRIYKCRRCGKVIKKYDSD